MVFKRRNRRSLTELAKDSVYPKGGFKRAVLYVIHRLRRLPDKPHRIARGVFAGVFASFTPFFGLHFLFAAGLAWVIRGNILAALLATFVGNPLTFPLIAITSVETGHWLLGIDVPLSFLSIVAAFSAASAELWENIRAMFTSEPTHWASLTAFFQTFYWPYVVGGILPGLAVGLLFYWATIPILGAYQKLRAGKLREGVERRRRARQARLLTSGSGSGDQTGDDGPPSSS